MALTPIPSFTCGTIGYLCLAQFAPPAPSMWVTAQVTLTTGDDPGKAAALTWERAKLGLEELLPTSGTRPTGLYHCQRQSATACPHCTGPGQ